MSKKRAKPFLIYIGFLLILVGILSLVVVGGLTEGIILSLCLLIGFIFLSIGFDGFKHRGLIITVVITCVVFTFIIGGTYFTIVGNPMEKDQAKQEVLNYLIQTKHYTANDILQINGYYRMFVNRNRSTCHYGTKVILKNNPETVKYYMVCSKNKVIVLDPKIDLID